MNDKKEENISLEDKLSSRSIFINVLFRVAVDICRGEEKDRELQELLNILDGLSRKMLLLYSNLRDFVSEDKKSKITDLKDRLDDFAMGTVKLKKYFHHRDSSLLSSSVLHLYNTTESLFDFLSEFKEVNKITSLSPSPLIDELIIAASGVNEDMLPEKALLEKVIFLKDFLNTSRDQILTASSDPDSVTLIDEVPYILKRIDHLSKGLEEILFFFQNKDKKHIKKGIDIIQKDTTSLQNSLELLYDAANIISKVICLRCGHKNSLHADFCVLCRALLPKAAPRMILPERTEYVYETGDFCYILTENLNYLLDGVKDLEEGKISENEFVSILSFMAKKTCKVRDVLLEITAYGSEFSDILKEIFPPVFDGILYGIKTLETYLKDKKEENLDQGLTYIFEASRYLYYIQNIGIEAEKELERREKEG